MEWYFGAKQAIKECLPLSKVVALCIGYHNSVHNELRCASDGARSSILPVIHASIVESGVLEPL